MGNEIAYLMPTEYKIFLGKGALPPYNPRQGASPLNPSKNLAHRLSFTVIQNGMTPMHSAQRGWAAPIFDDSWGKEPFGGI